MGISEIKLALDLKNLFAIAGIFTLINIFLRPIIKFILSPIIFLTFGLGTILVNAFLLWIVDLYSKNLTISSFKSLLFSTLIVSFINGLLHFSAKALNK